MGNVSTSHTKHSWLIKAVAILLIFSITLLWIPFPVNDTPNVVEQAINIGVETIDQIDGQNNFTPGKNAGQSTAQKLRDAFEK